MPHYDVDTKMPDEPSFIFEGLEPCAGKLASTVLRRVAISNGRHLSDKLT
jgi:hypothetical protein